MQVTKAQWLVVGQFTLFAIIAVAFFLLPPVSGSVLRILGFALALLGLGIILLAIFQYYSVNRSTPNISPQPDQSAGMVQTGIYARIRHPIYTGVLCGGFGVVIFHGNIVLILLAIALLVFFTYKSMYEDTLLSQRYPDYATYIQRTGRFLPFRWM